MPSFLYCKDCPNEDNGWGGKIADAHFEQKSAILDMALAISCWVGAVLRTALKRAGLLFQEI